jgi:GT2 family glycosyltransferase
MKRLKQTLRSYKELEYRPLEFIFLDNGSTDGSVDFAREVASECDYPWTIVELKENIGAPRGRNEGAKHVRGKYLWLLDNDIEVTPGVVGTLVDHLEKHEEVKVCMPLVYEGDTRTALHNTGGRFTPYGIGFRANPNLYRRRLEDLGDSVPISYPQCAVLFVSAEWWRKLDGFDTIARILLDDYDFGVRTWIAGGTVELLTTCKVYHHEDAPNSYYVQPDWLWFEDMRGSIMYVLKNYQFRTIAYMLPLLFARQGVQIAKKTIRGRDYTFAFRVWLRCVLSLFKPATARHLWKGRRFVQSLRKRRDRDFLFKM